MTKLSKHNEKVIFLLPDISSYGNLTILITTQLYLHDTQRSAEQTEVSHTKGELICLVTSSMTLTRSVCVYVCYV